MLQHNNKNTGFTLLELLIVITIIAILASLGIPNYQKYSIRAKLMEGFALIEPIKMYIMEYVITNGTFPDAIDHANLQLTSKFISNITWQSDSYSMTPSGLILINFNPATISNALYEHNMLGIRATLQPDGSINWACAKPDSYAIDSVYLAGNCTEEYLTS